MESWGKCNEKPLPNKKAFHSELNLKEISDKEYAHAQKVWDVWVKKLSGFDERFIKNYDGNSNTGYFLEVDVEYPKNSFNCHKYLLFLAEREKSEKCEILVCNIKDKEKYVFHIRALKLALNHELIQKKVPE